VQTVLRTAKDYGQPPVPGLGPVSNWPWTLVRLMQLMEHIRYAVEVSAAHDIPTPPKEIIFSRFWTKQWIERHKQEKKDKAKNRGG
jgi:hypothetical protein